MMVEKLERLLFSKACVPPPLEQQGDTTPCEQGRFTLPWKHQGHRIMDISDYAESKAFMSMVIKSAWLVLNLAFSFEPIAEVVRVSMGIVFNVDYMEDMMLQSEEGYGGSHDHNGHDDDYDDGGGCGHGQLPCLAVWLRNEQVQQHSSL